MKFPALRDAPIGAPQGEGELSGLLLGLHVGDDAHDVALLHDEELLAVDLDLGARPLAEQHAITNLDVDRDQLAGLVAATRADGDDFALRRFFLGSVRNDDTACGLLFGVDTLDHDAVVKRTEFHEILLGFCDYYFWIGSRNERVLAAFQIGL